MSYSNVRHPKIFRVRKKIHKKISLLYHRGLFCNPEHASYLLLTGRRRPGVTQKGCLDEAGRREKGGEGKEERELRGGGEEEKQRAFNCLE